MDIEFSLNDILGYFQQKGGKVIYTDLVTHFKAALSNPNTLANARVIFKNYVNTLATVINEDGMKYLILRPKYMKTLSQKNLTSNSISSSSSSSASSSSSSPPTSPLQTKAIISSTTNYRYSNENGNCKNGNGLKHLNDLNHANPYVDDISISSSINCKLNRPSSLLITDDLNDLNLSTSTYNNNNSSQQNDDKTNVINNPKHLLANSCVSNDDSKPRQLPYYSNHNRTTRYSSLMNNGASNASIKNVLPTINEININSTKTSSSIVNNNCNENENDPLLLTATIADDSPPPRPPPRKKNSFSQSSLSPSSSLTNVLVASAAGSTSAPNNEPFLRNNAHHHHHNHRQQQSNDTLIEAFETVNTVKKEIQELSRTPGRVKEHAQILNKLVQDTKLPMPTTTTNSISQVVNNKIRYNPSSQQSDTDSGSVHLTDPLKKRWIIASSNCDYQELVSLLKQDPELCRYCDCIMGYSALHWAAKFNKPEIVKLMAGTFKADPNVKSFSGSTPLHIAAQFKNDNIMKMLIYHYDANPDIRDNYGKKAHQYLPKKTNEFNVQSLSNRQLSDASNSIGNSPVNICNTGGSAASTTALSATENLKNNLRNKISHQSMLVRNTLRNTKAFKRRKSMNEKSKQKHQQKQQNAVGNKHS